MRKPLFACEKAKPSVTILQAASDTKTGNHCTTLYVTK
jgi:hypothetical protein